MKIKNLVFIAIMTALICVCSWVTLTIGPVPFTLQTFAVFLAFVILGGRDASIAIALYILLGIVGVPVFAGFKSGIGTIMGPTGGFIIGYLLIGLIYWAIPKKLKSSNIAKLIVFIVCNAICYAAGVAWFVLFKYGTIETAISACVIPFIVPDALKISLAVIIGGEVSRKLKLKN